MSDEEYNIYGVITGTIGLLGLLNIAWIYTRLPTRKLDSVQNFLGWTEAQLNKGLERGLHTNENDLRHFHVRIWDLESAIEDMRRKVCVLRTWRAQVRGWWDGLTNEIDTIHEETQALHLEIIESSSRDRKRLAQEGYTENLARFAGARSRERLSSVMPFAITQDISLATVETDTSTDASPPGESVLPHGACAAPDLAAANKHNDVLPCATLSDSDSCPYVSLPDDDTPDAAVQAYIRNQQSFSPHESSTAAQEKDRKCRSMRRDVLRRFSHDQLCSPTLLFSSSSGGTLPARYAHGRDRFYARYSGFLGRPRAQAGGARGKGLPLPALSARSALALASNTAYDGDDESDG
ncbi:hypothetical protein C8Q77DRAFT_724095 [Trametes polyzona]|nr:hypothetical protein C8Q77DRAFT_724095 [Trametes polyzona]